MSKTPGAWSYSGIKLFETCPKKYEAEKITKEVKFTDSEATLYGKSLHLAAEEYIRDGKELPGQFAFIKPYLDKLVAIPGEKHCELKLGVKKDDGRLVACDFFDSSVWFRGIADLVIIDGAKGWIVDYKTGKSAKYADTRQLALMAAALFLKYPELEKIKTSLLFVVSKEFIRAEYEAERGLDIFGELSGILEQRSASYATGVFNPKQNGLCKKWCPVTSCPHQGA
jgi:PD-(D/E)XK nuclease superfamily